MIRSMLSSAFKRFAEHHGPVVEITVDGKAFRAAQGDLLATALASAGILALRNSPHRGAPRGAFCFMGVCQECAIFVDGEVRQACLTPVRDGMKVELRGVP